MVSILIIDSKSKYKSDKILFFLFLKLNAGLDTRTFCLSKKKEKNFIFC